MGGQSAHMSLPPQPSPPEPGAPAESAFKSRGGLARVWRATTYSWAGLRAALRHEAAFRQELAFALPLLLALPWIAPGPWQGLLMAGSLVAVLVVELLNSAIEALADAQSVEHHELLGRAKDLGSAAVMLTLIFAGAVWLVLLWP